MNFVNFFLISNKILKNYNINNDKYNRMKINLLVYNYNKRFVSVFKDYLIFNDNEEFLYEFYKKNISFFYFKKYNNKNIFPLNYIESSINKTMNIFRIKKKILIKNINKKHKEIIYKKINNVKLNIADEISKNIFDSFSFLNENNINNSKSLNSETFPSLNNNSIKNNNFDIEKFCDYKIDQA